MENFMYNELTEEELLDIDGGVAPVIIAVAKIAGTAFLAGAGWRIGEAVYDAIFN